MPIPQKNQKSPMKGKLRMVLEMDQETGQFRMEGPIKNRAACYGMLGLAHEMIAANGARPQQVFEPVPKMPAPEALLKKH